MELFNGTLPILPVPSTFGDYFNLQGHIPADCDCILVMVNTGSGLNVGWPQPVGFVKLAHQLYLRDLIQLIEDWHKQRASVDQLSAPNLWRVMVAPLRSAEYLTVWEAAAQAPQSTAH